MSPPWDTYYCEIEAFFKQDPEVRVLYDDEKKVITLYVNNEAKADALNVLLPSEKTFGNVTVKINVTPANTKNFATTSDALASALNGNNAIRQIIVSGLPGLGEFTYVICAPEVAQFFTDNLQDYCGFTSMLFADLARDIFEVSKEGIFFCTEVSDFTLDNLISRKNEWP